MVELRVVRRRVTCAEDHPERYAGRPGTYDDAVRRADPMTALELGTYCGYGALRIARAAPQASGAPAPRMPLAPIMPFDRSAMCIEPPLPRQ